MKKQLFSILLICVSLGYLTSLSSCKEDEPDKPTNDEELITTLKLKFFHAADSSSAGVFVFRDVDGEGGMSPQMWDTIRLNSGKAYFMELELLNESNAADVEDITAEIREEAAEHLFCFGNSVPGFSMIYADSDGTHPIGIKTNWNAQTAGTGNVTVTLKHQPDGTKNGNCAPGDTDIEVVFPTIIQ